MISERNRKITIRRYLFAQNSDGYNIKQASLSWEMWASVEQLNGNRNLEQGQVQYQETYKIKKRHELSRPIYAQDEIIYESALFSIDSIKEDTEGKKKIDIITAHSTGSNVSASTDINTVVDMVHYVATGGEYGFQNDLLIGKNLLLVYRDGVNYYPVTEGTPTAKETLYDAAAGSLDFSHILVAMQADEVTDVYILK